MLLSLLIIVALIWAAVIGNIYSNFLVFYSNFSETENYNKAYYASIAALERAELVTKQRQPWFEWTWWWVKDISVDGGNPADRPITEGFSYMSRDNNHITTSSRHIDSLTKEIPKWWNWNVDRMLSTGDSFNFNKMDYNMSEVFLLYRDPGIDPSNDNPYKKLEKKNMIKSKVTKVDGHIRLPQYLYETFRDLDTSTWLILPTEKDDAIVDRQVMWIYSGSQFTIFATQDTRNWHATSEDTAIRESDLNGSNGGGFNFSFIDNKNPKVGSHAHDWTIISPNSNEIGNFKQIFAEDDRFSQNQIKFSLLNFLKNVNWDIYPFLEYQIKFYDAPVPDKYYTINSDWGYWDYMVTLTIIKPTIKESILKSFTTIFK